MKDYILLIDDDPEELLILQEIVRSNHLEMECRWLPSIELAKDAVRKRMPRLILLDMNMPKVDGLETLRQIKEEEYTKLIPVILYSTYISDRVRNLAKEMGAEAILQKNSSSPNLVELITRFGGNHSDRMGIV
ncbi:MAG: hypothetical protein C5B52_15125 [Bacteroidetes bacterium]|nr:MAG: hypothetical protein C5B52_15125 [Bacteroidota bacterium]